MPFTTARIVWEGLLSLAFIALLLGSLALTGLQIKPFDVLAMLAAAAVAGPVMGDFALGQVAMIGAAGVAVALAAFARNALLSGVATFVAAFQPNLVLPLAARMTDRRTIATVVVAAVAFVAATLAMGGGTGGLLSYVHRLAEHGAGERFIAIQYTIPAIAASFGSGEAIADALGAVAGIVCVAGVAFLAMRFKAEPVLTVCVAIALLPLAIPFFHEHDFVIELIPVIVLAASGNGRIRLLAGIAAAAVLVDWFGFAQRPTAIAQIAALAIAMTLAYAALPRRSDPSLLDFVPALTAFVLIAVCVPIALHAPAPTWPDMLATGYRADPHADISAVWTAEQRRSGLGALVPAWGLLRALPLAGCALLAFAAWREIRYRGAV